MASYDAEEELVVQKRGKWSQPGVPHKGWVCVDIEDLGEPSLTCEMCESQNIRYVHYMEHQDYPEILGAGCICAGHMEENLYGAKERDTQMHSRAQKRNRWLSRAWKVSRKGNEYIKSDGYIVTIYPKGPNWGATISQDAGSLLKHSRIKYTTSDQAKLAAFDVITKLLARN
jgi:hypothetical protein